MVEKQRELEDKIKALELKRLELAKVTESFKEKPSNLGLREQVERLPEFGGKSSVSAVMWLRRMERTAEKFKWDDDTILFAMSQRFRGAAQLWLEGAEDVFENWCEEMRTEFLRNFPTSTDVSDIHRQLLVRVRRPGESIEEFFQDVVRVGRSGDLCEKSIIKYIITGLNDNYFKDKIMANNCGTLLELLDQLKWIESIREHDDFRRTYQSRSNGAIPEVRVSVPDKANTSAGSSMNPVASTSSPESEKTGAVRERRNFVRKCFICHMSDHIAKDCPKKKNPGGSVNQVIASEWTEIDPYHKYMEINGCRVEAFVDLGSDCVTMTENTARELNLKFKPSSRVLNGFGGGKCAVIGELSEVIKVDGVEAETIVMCVPNQSQKFKVMIGRSYFDQPHIKITKEKDKLTVEKCAVSEVKSRSLVDIGLDDIRFGESLSEEERQSVFDLVSNEYRDCFAKESGELGESKLGGMEIELKSDKVINRKPYRISFAKREKVTEIINELLKNDIIQESESEYSSPVVLVPKRDGGDRLCVDFRQLNECTVKQSFPMPIVEEQLNSLGNKRFYIVLDMMQGYHQVPIDVKSRRYTAFQTHDGHYEYKRMPFGLANAPAVFQRIINKLKCKMKPNEVIVFLDDLVIPADTIEQGMEILSRFLTVVRNAGLTFKLSKCVFFATEIEYLGHRISVEGIKPGINKMKAIREFPVPTSLKEVNHFIGLTGFFRRFVPNYAKIAAPLTSLKKKDAQFIWSDECQSAMTSLIEKLTTNPILAVYDPKAEHEIHTDASSVGLAGILMQQDHSELRPVMYFSRKTTELEQKYHSYELETIAVVESLERFRIYVMGKRFKVVTDCQAVAAAKAKTELVPRIARWWLKLAEFDFELEHRVGTKMTHVDALSRNPVEPSTEMVEFDKDILAVHLQVEELLIVLQRTDAEISQIRQVLQEAGTKSDSKQIRSDYCLQKEVVYRKVGDQIRWVVPKSMKWRVTRSCHDDQGHFGVERTLEHLRKYFWFSRMRDFVKKYIESCVECAFHKVSGGKKRTELHPIPKEPIPFQTVHIDNLGPFVRSSQGNEYIIAAIDAFTKFVMLRAVKNTKTKPVLAFLDEISSYFGCPGRIVSDKGTCYTAKEFTKFCEDNLISCVKTATGSPRANGQVERLNRTILTAVKTMSEDPSGKDWDKRLRALQFSLNSSKQKTTQLSPHEVLFGFSPRNALKNKLILAIQDMDDDKQLPDLEKIRKEVDNRIIEDQGKQKIVVDGRNKPPYKYTEGDMVLIENDHPATGQSRKLLAKYRGPYQVTKVLGNDRYVVGDIPGMRISKRMFSSVYAADRMKPWVQSFIEEEDDQLNSSFGGDEGSGKDEL